MSVKASEVNAAVHRWNATAKLPEDEAAAFADHLARAYRDDDEFDVDLNTEYRVWKDSGKGEKGHWYTR